MKLENTLENKAKFYYNYLDCNIRYCHRDGDFEYASLYYTDDESSNLMSLSWFEEYYENDYFLELTPLSQITDEDAIEVAKLESEIFNCKYEHISIEREANKGVIVQKFNNCAHIEDAVFIGDDNRINFSTMKYTTYQYLQLKSYALPYMGLSVDDLISYGWLVLKED